MQIRQETEKDYALIHSFVQAAFSTAAVADGREQDYVAIWRQSPVYIPELALVVEQDAAIIGYSMLTKFMFEPTSLTSSSFACLLLAPIAVALEHRNKGIGASLINQSKEKALQLGYDAIFLVGNPAYYNKFGFQETQHFSITHLPADIPAQYVLVCELRPDVLHNCTGSIDFTITLPE